MRLSARTLAAAAALAAACASPREAWRSVSAPEVLVEMLPRGAALEVDGRPLGQGSRTVEVPDGEHVYRLRIAAPGYDPAEVAQPGAKLAGARVGVALRPPGFGAARRLDYDDPASLVQAASALLRVGRPAPCVEYADRALQIAEVPQAHRLLGAAHAQLGHRDESVRHYSAYLTLVPDAPDARSVARAIEAARGDVTIPAARTR